MVHRPASSSAQETECKQSAKTPLIITRDTDYNDSLSVCQIIIISTIICFGTAYINNEQRNTNLVPIRSFWEHQTYKQQPRQLACSMKGKTCFQFPSNTLNLLGDLGWVTLSELDVSHRLHGKINEGRGEE